MTAAAWDDPGDWAGRRSRVEWAATKARREAAQIRTWLSEPFDGGAPGRLNRVYGGYWVFGYPPDSFAACHWSVAASLFDGPYLAPAEPVPLTGPFALLGLPFRIDESVPMPVQDLRGAAPMALSSLSPRTQSRS